MFYTSSRLRKQHGHWYAVLGYKDGDRHKERTKRLDATTKRAALAELDEWRLEMELAEPVRRCTTPAVEYALALIDGMESRMEVERSTASDYRKGIRSWVPYIGDVRLCDLTRRQVEDAVAEMLRAGRVPSTVCKRLTVLKMACADAVSRGDLKESPLAGIRRPRLTRTRKNSIDDDLMRQRVKDKLASMPLSRYVVAYYIALYVGLRRGEIVGLQVQDVDLESRRGWVRRSIGVDGTEEYVKAPKTGGSRDFPLPETLRDVLSRWIALQRSERGVLRPTDWLLGYPDGHNMSVDVLSRKWASLAENECWLGAAGKRPTLHDLRHTFATEAIAAGIDVKTVSSILGHANASMTLDVYATADPEAKRRAAAVIDGMI